MNRLAAVLQYNDALHKRTSNPFPPDKGWDGTNGPWCFLTVIQVEEGEYTSGRVVKNKVIIDDYTVPAIKEYTGHHSTPFRLELIYEES